MGHFWLSLTNERKGTWRNERSIPAAIGDSCISSIIVQTTNTTPAQVTGCNLKVQKSVLSQGGLPSVPYIWTDLQLTLKLN